jgi:hypothetical protein
VNHDEAVFADHVRKAGRLRDFAPEPLLVWRVADHIVSVHRSPDSRELWLFSSDRSGWDSGPMETRSALVTLGSDTWLVGGAEPPGSWVHVLEPERAECVAGRGFWLCAVPANVPLVKARVIGPDGDALVEIEMPSLTTPARRSA